MPLPQSRTEIASSSGFTARGDGDRLARRAVLLGVTQQVVQHLFDIAGLRHDDRQTGDRSRQRCGGAGAAAGAAASSVSIQAVEPTGSISNSVPESSRASTSMFSMIRCRRSASWAISPSATARLSSSTSVPRRWRISALPRIVVIGVLSSCETRPRNSSFTSFARRRSCDQRLLGLRQRPCGPGCRCPSSATSGRRRASSRSGTARVVPAVDAVDAADAHLRFVPVARCASRSTSAPRLRRGHQDAGRRFPPSGVSPSPRPV